MPLELVSAPTYKKPKPLRLLDYADELFVDAFV